MEKVNQILLLDIDGVLLEPLGYREAVKTTINSFWRQAGFGYAEPDEETLSYFEAVGITNEWDIVPICLAIGLEDFLDRSPDFEFPIKWGQFPRGQALHLNQSSAVDYRSRIARITGVLAAGKSPSIAILDAGMSGAESNPFPRLARRALFKELFGHNKQVRESLTTFLFQNYVLGDRVFQDIYHQIPQVVTPSYLSKFDRPLLSVEVRQSILQLAKSQRLHPVAYTARPSLPPVNITVVSEGYSPEAEMAMDLVGLPDIPLIAYGRLMYVADRLNISTDHLLKPSPFQALAAILAANMPKANEKEALNLAVDICALSGLSPFEANGRSGSAGSIFADQLSELKSMKLAVNVFEDSPIGIHATKHACRLLSVLNVPVECQYWGVARDYAKKKALEGAGAVVFERTDEAITTVLKQID